MLFGRFGKLIIGLIVVGLLIFGLVRYGGPALRNILGLEEQIPFEVQTSEEQELYSHLGDLKQFENRLVYNILDLTREAVDRNLNNIKKDIEDSPDSKLSSEGLERKEQLLKDIEADRIFYEAEFTIDIKEEIKKFKKVADMHSNPVVLTTTYARLVEAYLKRRDFNEASKYANLIKEHNSEVSEEYLERISKCRPVTKCSDYGGWTAGSYEKCLENPCYVGSTVDGTGCWYRRAGVNNCEVCRKEMVCEDYQDDEGSCERNPCRTFDFRSGGCTWEGSKCASKYCCSIHKEAERLSSVLSFSRPTPKIIECDKITDPFVRCDDCCGNKEWDDWIKAEYVAVDCGTVSSCAGYTQANWCVKNDCDVGPSDYVRGGCYHDGASCKDCKPISGGISGVTCEDYGTSEESCKQAKFISPCSSIKHPIKGEPCKWDGSKCDSTICCVKSKADSSDTKIVDCDKIPNTHERCDTCCEDNHWLVCLDLAPTGTRLSDYFGRCDTSGYII